MVRMLVNCLRYASNVGDGVEVVRESPAAMSRWHSQILYAHLVLEFAQHRTQRDHQDVLHLAEFVARLPSWIRQLSEVRQRIR